MYLLTEMPLFLEFIDRFLKKAGSKIEIKKSKNLFLYDKCFCSKNYCNTFVLRSKRKIEDEYYVYHTIETNKGTFGIELFDNGDFVFLAQGNNTLPFKKEFEKMFNRKSSVSNNLIIKNSKRQLTYKDKLSLEIFFLDLQVDSIYIIHNYIDECMRLYI